MYLHSSARVFRNVFDFKANNYDLAGEIYLYFLWLDKGKSYFEHEVMSVYRITGKGSWSSMSKYEQSQAIIKTYLIANDFLNNKYADVFYNWVLPNFNPLIQSFCKRLKKIFGVKITMKVLHFAFWQKINKILNKRRENAF